MPKRKIVPIRPDVHFETPKTPGELKAEILRLVDEQPGITRDGVEQQLGFERGYELNARNSSVARMFNAAFLSLRKTHRIIEYGMGQLVLYTPPRHQAVLAREIESQELWVASVKRDYERQQAKLGRLQVEMAKLTKAHPDLVVKASEA